MMNKRFNAFGEELGELLEFQNISINEYAERIGTSSKNLIDIINGNVSLSFNMMCNISFISDIPLNYIYSVEEGFKIDRSIDLYLKRKNITIKAYLNKFNYKELKEKYNLNYRNERDSYIILEDIFKYLRITNPELIYKKDNHIFYKSKNDKPELLALWLERCYRVIQNQEIKEYSKDNIDKVVELIKKEALDNKFDKDKLIKIFNDNGIFLAIEPDLTGAKIRGAFKVLCNKPAIYITEKHKRYADVYFALLHELAHCKSDFNRAKNGSIVSYENSLDEEEYEIKADKMALNWMVNDNEYDKIIKSKSFNNLNSFIVYRLAKDGFIKYNSKIYQENNKLIEEIL